MKRRHSVSRLSLPLSLGLSAAVMASVGLVVGACSGLSVESDCEESKTCAVGPGDGGGGGEGGFDVVAPPGCDLTKSPKESAACVDDAVGVFVSATGDDGATGAKASPVKSVARGVEIAASKGLPRVYVCEGSYDKAVEIKAPVSVYGGFACAGWTYSGTKPKLAPAKGVALKVTKVTGAVLVEDFEIVGSADAAVPGDSAIGVFVSESGNVTLRTSKLSAGAGTAGLSAQQKAQAANAPKANAAGSPPNIVGSSGAKNTCADGDSLGGTGGTVGANDATAGQPGLGGGQAGPIGTDCAAGGGGTAGAGGGPGTAGPAVVSKGSVSSSQWTPASGGKGAPGTRGQGGGGGGSRTGAGGGGGSGGCGGDGGEGGGGGGGSIALASVSSTVSLLGCVVSSGGAGDGGDGAPGQLGQPPGGGGGGATVTAGFDGCAGGQGGTGGNGGAGGGGAGGVSVGILFKGTEPTKDSNTTITPGTAGNAGKGGASNDGPAGVSAPTLKAD